MALTTCPECAEKLSTSATTCPHCGYSPRPPVASPPKPSAAGGLPRRFRLSVDSAVPGTPAADAWMKLWSNACGVMLLVGFLFPMVVQGWRESTVIWQWDLMQRMKGDQVFGMILPVLLGVATLIVGNTMKDVPRAVAIFGMSLGTWVLYALLARAPEMNFSGMMGKAGGLAVILVLMPLSACAIAIGNRIRKRHPEHPLPRVLAGTGGAVLLLCFVIPVAQDKPIIAGFFDGDAWKHAWPLMLVFLTFLGYGVGGAISFRKFPDVDSFTRLMSLAARVLLWGAPGSLLIWFMVVTDGKGIGTAVTMAIKVFCLWYGHLLLIAVGLTSWIEHSLARGSSERAA